MQEGMTLIEALQTGGNTASIAMVVLLFKQWQTISMLKERLVKLETHIDILIGEKK